MSAPGAVIGLDPGERRIGVALAVPGGTMALPLTVIEREAGWLEALSALAVSHNAAGVVVGLPVCLDGSEGPAASRVRVFAAEVAAGLGLPVTLFDERLSTMAASRALRAGGTTGRRARGMIDRSAAAIILQAYLDAPAGAGEAGRGTA